jgi:transcriptional regulator with XRE-family HTH domain
MKISYKLKEFRKERGITQKDLASELEIALSVVSDIETGKKIPSSYVSGKLAKLSKSPIAYWIDEKESKFYIDNRDDFNMLKTAINKLKKNGSLVNGKADKIGWELLKRSLELDLEFDYMKGRD